MELKKLTPKFPASFTSVLRGEVKRTAKGPYYPPLMVGDHAGMTDEPNTTPWVNMQE